MPDTIEQYREAKNTYIRLRNQAKKELIARFHRLADELLQIKQELFEDFGEKITLPAKPKRTRPARAAASAGGEPVKPPASPSPRVQALEKKLALQKKKLNEAQTAGKPAKAIEDRIYELEDELRLARESS